MKWIGTSALLFSFSLILLIKKSSINFCTQHVAAIISRIKKYALIILIISTAQVAYSQNNRADSVAVLLASGRQDTNMVWLLKKFCNYYIETRADTVLMLAQKGLTIAKEIHYLKGEAHLLRRIGDAYSTEGNFTNSLEAYLKALDIFKSMEDWEEVADCFHKIGLLFKDMEAYHQSLSFFLKEKAVLQKDNNTESKVWNFIDIAEDYAYLNRFDSTKFFLDEAYTTAVYNYKGNLPGDFLNNLGDLYFKMSDNEKALTYYRQSVSKSDASTLRSVCQSALGMAKIFKKAGKNDSALYYGKMALGISQQYTLPLNTMRSATFLSNLYKNLHNTDSAFLYQQLAGNISYELFSKQKVKDFHTIYFSHQMKEQEIAGRLAESKQRYQFYIIIAAVLSFMGLIVLVNYFKSREKNIRLQQVHLLEQKQKEQKLLELQHEKTELEMQVLRAQMNPHFIFNVLNSINHFILTHKTEAASDYLVKFSRLIRTVLNISQKNFITLHQELECLELYIQMEQLRFENSFTYSIHYDNTIRTEEIYILPLILQPFVENAIWHGLMHKKEAGGKLCIEIKQQDQMLHCTITDNGIGRKKAAALKSKSKFSRKSMGMQITANRLQLLHNEKNKEVFLNVIDLNDETGANNGTKVIIHIPIKNHENITV